MDEVTAMKFYKLSLTQQRGSFYASNVPFSSSLAFLVLLLPLRKHYKYLHIRNLIETTIKEIQLTRTIQAVSRRSSHVAKQIISMWLCGQNFFSTFFMIWLF